MKAGGGEGKGGEERRGGTPCVSLNFPYNNLYKDFYHVPCGRFNCIRRSLYEYFLRDIINFVAVFCAFSICDVLV